jgi:hypothetical protein
MEEPDCGHFVPPAGCELLIFRKDLWILKGRPKLYTLHGWGGVGTQQSSVTHILMVQILHLQYYIDPGAGLEASGKSIAYDGNLLKSIRWKSSKKYTMEFFLRAYDGNLLKD